MTESVADIKRLVIGGRKTSQSPRLFVSEHDGELYATNSYWLTPVSRVAPLLAKFNLPTDVVGCYSVNGTVSPLDMEPPNVGALIPNVKDCTQLERFQVGTVDAYRKGSTGVWLAMFTFDGATINVDDAYLSFLTFGGDLHSHAIGYGSRLVGEPILRQAKPTGPVVIHAAREKQTGGINGPDGKYVPATWHADGEQFLGLLMPVRA